MPHRRRQATCIGGVSFSLPCVDFFITSWGPPYERKATCNEVGMATAVASLEAPPSNRAYQDEDDQITPAPQPLTGCRKAAMLLTFIGNQASAAILHLLTDEEVKNITREITVLPSLTEDERQAVLHDFVTKVEHP